jgi:hypothetical protein
MLAACGGTTVYEGTGASASTSTTSSTTSSTSNGSTGAGGNTTSSTGVGSDTASSTGAGGSIIAVGSSTGTGGNVPGDPCPAGEPTPGEPCSAADGQSCTYGDSVRPDCRDQFSCLSGSWMSTGGTCEQFTCPSAAPSSGDPCGATVEECNYGPTLCYCGCPGGLACEGPYEWSCADAPTTPGCPADAPNSGTACSAEGTTCSYGTSCTPDGVTAQCTNGFWQWQQVVCGA